MDPVASGLWVLTFGGFHFNNPVLNMLSQITAEVYSGLQLPTS
jgi:hypothetical protein